jgi:hypothetical protein
MDIRRRNPYAPGSERVKADTISIVEAAYDCEGDTRTWLGRMLDQVAPQIDRGFGVGVSMYEPGVSPDRMVIASRYLDKELFDAFMRMSLAYPDAFHRANSEPEAISTVTKSLKVTRKEAHAWEPYVKYMHPFGVRDVTGILARDPSGHAMVFNSPMPDLRRPTRNESASWSRITTHISAGARLRRAIGTLSSDDDLSVGADAVLSPSGSMVHGEGAAQNPDARESLCRAAKAIDRARSKARG